MAVIDKESAAGILRVTGWPATQINNALAVIGCESSFDTAAEGPVVDGHTHTGLFQISSVHGYPAGRLLDPFYNAGIARQLYVRDGWRPWECARSLGLPLDRPGLNPGGGGIDPLPGIDLPGIDAPGGLPSIPNPLDALDRLADLTPDGLADLVRDVGFGLVLAAAGSVLVILAARGFTAPAVEKVQDQLTGAAGAVL